MSAYDGVGGKLKLKGRALDVKAGGVKKKKKAKKQYDETSEIVENETSQVGTTGLAADPTEDMNETDKLGSDGHHPPCDDNLTPAEKRYIEQRARIDAHRLAKISDKSHRDRIQDFNQYLANLSEHYDIPKVGPG